MAEVQDEEQWLYGDDKEDSNIDGKEEEAEKTPTDDTEQADTEDKTDKEEAKKATEEPTETNGDIAEPVDENQEESQDAEQNGDKSKDDVGDDSSSDDEPTVTIGKIVKQPDILRPPPPTHRAAPTSGLKDEDFNSVGKVNGIPVTEFNLAELEEKPWRKPGADLSDYFNYGFTEDTWIKYCERQKAMRTNESGIGLTGLGINIAKGGMLSSSNIPVSIVNENSKYGGGIRKPAGVPVVNRLNDEKSDGPQSSGINTIQVMTADRRHYSNKVLGSGGPYDDMDFGGNPYGADFFSAPPPPSFYNAPPPSGPWGGGIPNVPPPGWGPGPGPGPDGLGVPPPLPPHHRGGMGAYFEEGSLGPGGHGRSKDEREMEKMRDSRDREHESRDRESRHHSNRRRSRSRSRSKSRHRKRTRSRSRSRSPSHRHKRKKSKRERETD